MRWRAMSHSAHPFHSANAMISTTATTCEPGTGQGDRVAYRGRQHEPDDERHTERDRGPDPVPGRVVGHARSVGRVPARGAGGKGRGGMIVAFTQRGIRNIGRSLPSPSMASISAAVSVKSKTSRLAAMCAGLVDFGISAMKPRCTCQRRITCTADFPWAARGGLDRRFAEEFRGSVAERVPRLGHDPVLGEVGQQLRLLPVRVQLDLVHDGRDARGGQQALEVGDREVADPDRAHGAGIHRVFQGPPRALHIADRLVQQHQVDRVPQSRRSTEPAIAARALS